MPIVDGFLDGAPLGNSSFDSCFLAVIRVLTTQMGLVMITVALPAIAPAIMDSTVVSFFEPRPDATALRSNADLVHSYPAIGQWHEDYTTRSQHTIVVNKICDADAKQRGVKAGEKPGDALALDNTFDSVQHGRLRAFRLDLSTRGERDQRIGKGHRQ